jgi:hypothetical protein
MIADFLRTKGAISVPPDFDDPLRKERHGVHLKKLADSIEQLREKIRRECGDDDEDHSP